MGVFEGCGLRVLFTHRMRIGKTLYIHVGHLYQMTIRFCIYQYKGWGGGGEGVARRSQRMRIISKGYVIIDIELYRRCFARSSKFVRGQGSCLHLI